MVLELLNCFGPAVAVLVIVRLILTLIVVALKTEFVFSNLVKIQVEGQVGVVTITESEVIGSVVVSQVPAPTNLRNWFAATQ